MLVLIPGILLLAIFGRLILSIFNPAYAENAFGSMLILIMASIPVSLIGMYNTVRNAQHRVASTISMNMLIAFITVILSVPLIRIMNIEGAAVSYLIANIIGASIVISRIKEPKELTLRLLSDIKDNVLSINS
jgi:O-antigen/teichoic acid export membrane protein